MIDWRTGPDYDIPWARFPFIKIVIPFVLGILCADIPKTAIPLSVVLLLLNTLLLIYYHRLAASQFSYVFWFGLAATFFWLFFGLLWASFHDERKLPHHFSGEEANPQELLVIISYFDEKERFWDCYTTVITRKDSIGQSAARGNLLLRIPKNTSYIPSNRDLIQGVFRIRVPEQASAPFDFNWRKMLHHRNIHYYSYLDTTRYKLILKSPPSLLEQTRNQIDNMIHTLVPSTRDYPVASAMLLGLRKKMDPELYQAYSGTGAVHILAVSGLHVGIIAHIFQVLFGFISYKGRKLKVLQVVLILTVIWLYTFLTGASPSILRSAVMFSLLHCSRLMQRDAPPLNVLAAAAFILLFINPFDIYNLGFQLSFLAMAGIFILYEPIRSFINTGNKVVQGLWKVLAVSMAAQLLIYPLIAYHFHQFAFYFWLTGLLSTPFSYLILICGMLSLAGYPFLFSWVPWLGLPLQYSIKWMNDSISWIYSLPLGRIQGWWPTPWDVLVLSVISLLLGYTYFQKTRRSFLVFLLTCIVFFGIMIIEEKLDQNRMEIVAGGSVNKPFIWIKDKQNTILYTINTDTLKPPLNYLERYNLPLKQVIHFNPALSNYSSGHLRLSGHLIRYKDKQYQLILNNEDSLVSTVTPSRVILLNKEWKSGMTHLTPFEIYSPDFVTAPNKPYPGQVKWERSESPYVSIRLK